MSRVFDVFLSVRAWLHDEGESPMTPDYINDILARTAASKQRPAWQSPWRWLLMQTSDTIRTVPRIAWPVLIAVILAAFVFAVAAVPGTPAVPGPSPSPSPAPAPSAVRSPTATASAQSLDGRLPPLHGPAANGLIAFTAAYSHPDGTATIWVVNPDGTDRRALISSPDALDGLTWAPDGRHLAYWAWSGGQATERMSLMVADADGNGSRALFDNGVTAAPPIVWSPDSTMIAIDDGKSPSTTSVIDATTGAVILTHEGGGATWSPDGSRLAIVAGTGLQIVGLDGVVETTLGDGASSPDWSPDGTHIAIRGPGYINNEISVVDVVDGTAHDITDHANQVSRRRGPPHWSPDGSHVMYSDSALGVNNGRGVSVSDGTGGAVTWLDIPGGGPRWSPDGLTVLSSNGIVANSMFITDPTGVRAQTTINVSDLHTEQLSMSWQRVAP